MRAQDALHAHPENKSPVTPSSSRVSTGRGQVGRFRVLYSVSNTRLVILVLKIGHRKDVCR
jgi:mRNA-degrading endonuclease RelE of RelBE toxin-antitoxin system